MVNYKKPLNCVLSLKQASVIKFGASQPHLRAKHATIFSKNMERGIKQQELQYLVSNSQYKPALRQLCGVYWKAIYLSEWKREDPTGDWKSGRAAWLSDSLHLIPLLAHSFTGPLIDPSFFHPCIHAASTHLSTPPSVHLSTHPLISHPPTRHLSIIHPSCHPVTHF